MAIVLDCGRVLHHPRAMSFTAPIEIARGWIMAFTYGILLQ